ncbi:hypothetical protein Fmac_025547 [Flemingia macrophylla]|uniref:Uncharacterized protein n=1 Tax=Flemingia macrophylla TaxID=520843 RepID=A0ABD1LSM2_9FABA
MSEKGLGYFLCMPQHLGLSLTIHPAEGTTLYIEEEEDLSKIHNLPLITLLSAISSIASAAKQEFIAYAKRVLAMMKSFTVLTNDEDLHSRARPTELVGIVRMSVGRMGMEPIIPSNIKAAISGFELEYSELR